MRKVFETVLVANRGEIACRVIRTLRSMGIRSAAVYSDADAGARHVREADLAVRIGPAPAAESYLRIDAVIEACKATGAEAVHPGYGFLSENVNFAQALEAAGIVFIGPNVGAIGIMGDKIRSKNHVASHGVPVVPGIDEPGLDDDRLVLAAEKVGYPLLIKPSAGGGGKGMVAVQRPEELSAALAAARRVAASAFGDDTLFLERLIARPRHIEVQVLCDQYGNAIHLGERECSLQRRHQKVIEEAPSSLLDEATRARIGEAACEAARSVDYTGAGTVEFLVSDDTPDEFFFMEMNTRLQVEHPVTELVTGLDLVEWQVRIAAGEALPMAQSDVVLTGHAVEARVYAEDPAQQFLPSAGTVLELAEAAGEGVRVDSSLLPGLTIPSDYDPLLSKVIAWGADRQQALARLDGALAETSVLGIHTNIEHLRSLLADDDVHAGRLDTTLIDRKIVHQQFRRPHDAELAVAAVDWLFRERETRGETGAAGRAGSAWRSDGWRLSGPRPRTVSFDLGGGEHREVSVAWAGDTAAGRPGGAVVSTSGGSYAVVPDRDGQAVEVDGVRRPLRHAFGEDGTIWLGDAGWSARLVARSRESRLADTLAGIQQAEGQVSPDVRSPMPGTVTSVAVANGEQVSAGQPLLTVEAMKMEHQLSAGIAGEVSINLKPGDLVKADQVVAVVRAADPAPGPEQKGA
ncbi:acetyl/propionyl/methylcrotonyl-CoA carboxylase subunit alpha [Arthrobacter sulfonylureivorans]|uniref:biotin carboxylase n=1 Tax=Arthrobacter sulfonylureivorans TaxID=2486855 RepID=A0ABY3W3W8_9MICC|nr:biotin carboxylase N-terminal domain-containing protein [Arthrobacter sulfonylureivorans]UNK44835.1 biotin/lipoyl-binding protein [Arthrobacter sulfonylureivorans]